MKALELMYLSDEEQDTYIETLSTEEKIEMAHILIDHAKYCLDEIIDSVRDGGVIK